MSEKTEKGHAMAAKQQQGQAAQSHPYDNALKALFGDRGAEIIPELVPGAEVIEERDSEIKRENLRADIVRLILYRGEPHILNMELQTDADSNMPKRMLRYHVDLHLTHDLPVLSVVLYLFETDVPTPPFEEKSGEEVLLSMKYQVVALWTLDARECVRKGVLGMYTLLPGMGGADAQLLLYAIGEMEKHFPRPFFEQHMRRFWRILRRAKTLSEQDKQTVEARIMQTYDSLIDEDPEVQERVARGKVEGARQIVVDFVEARFPDLKELAQQRVGLLTNSETLSLLAKQIATVPDEATARWLLGTFGES